MENKRVLNHPKVELFDITIDNVTMADAVETVWSWLDTNDRRYVVTPNVDHVLRYTKDPEFVSAYKKASLVIPDGMPLIWSSRLLGTPLKERVTGSDLFPLLCERSAKEGRRIFFLGSMPGVAELAEKNLQKRYAGFKLCGFYSPPFGFEKNPAENEKIVKMLNDTRAEILMVALGAPKQEKWTFHHLDKTCVNAALCIGASIDFEAGVIKRAPEWMRGIGMEWIWRLMHDPKRLWKRYLIEDLPFFSILAREFAKSLRGKKQL